MLTYVLYINDRYKSVKVVFLHICLNPDCERSTPVSKKVIFLHTYLLPVFERSTQIGKKSSFYILTYMLTYVMYANDRYKSVKVIFLHTCLHPDCERLTPVSENHFLHTYLRTVCKRRHKLVKRCYFTYLLPCLLMSCIQMTNTSWWNSYFSYLWPVYERSSQVDFLLTYTIWLKKSSFLHTYLRLVCDNRYISLKSHLVTYANW